MKIYKNVYESFVWCPHQHIELSLLDFPTIIFEATAQYNWITPNAFTAIVYKKINIDIYNIWYKYIWITFIFMPLQII